MFAGKKSAQIREILINESAWEEMTCLFAPSLAVLKTQESLHKPIVMGIRPEDIHPDAQEENNISAKISVAELTGAEFMLYTTVGGHELVVRAGALNDYHAGENITIHFDMTKCHFFDAETEIAIR